MNSLLAHSGRVLLTGVMVALAGALGWHLWSYYMDAPWTRDGKVRADVIRLAPDVSGIVSEVLVTDNQAVKKGDELFRLDEARFQLALRAADTRIVSTKAHLEMARSDAARVKRLDDAATTQQRREQIATALEEADAAYRQALVDRDVARLNLERATVTAPVDGIVTNLTLRVGNYVASGMPVIAVIDSGSFYVAGYFEENKLERIQIGAPARVRLMGSGLELKGRVASLAGGIEDRERVDSASMLANVTPTFSWVRLAQRVPIRIALENVPASVHLVAGRTASVYISD